MFRLVMYGEEDMKKESLYQYVSKQISDTIAEHIDYHRNKFYDFFYIFSSDDFFEGISKYLILDNTNVDVPYFLENNGLNDLKVGYIFTQMKMQRMKEKMLDPDEVYTFDIFEERILADICYQAQYPTTSIERECTDNRKISEKIKQNIALAQKELREKYKLDAKTAKDFAEKMFRPSKMLLREDEDDNIIFWDDDYSWFFRDGFVSGIERTKGLVGEESGYGYQYTKEIFTDIGCKAPLALLGTEEANRIVSQVQKDNYLNWLGDIMSQVRNAKSLEEVMKMSED